MESLSYRPEELVELASAHRALLWFAASLVPSFILAAYFPLVLILMSLVAPILYYNLAEALREPTPALYAFLGLLPGFAVLVLLSLHMRAVAAFRAHGVEVGLTGADRAALAALLSGDEAPSRRPDDQT